MHAQFSFDRDVEPQGRAMNKGDLHRVVGFELPTANCQNQNIIAEIEVSCAELIILKSTGQVKTQGVRVLTYT
jgi:hypothetical protein